MSDLPPPLGELIRDEDEDATSDATEVGEIAFVWPTSRHFMSYSEAKREFSKLVGFIPGRKSKQYAFRNDGNYNTVGSVFLSAREVVRRFEGWTYDCVVDGIPCLGMNFPKAWLLDETKTKYVCSGIGTRTPGAGSTPPSMFNTFPERGFKCEALARALPNTVRDDDPRLEGVMDVLSVTCGGRKDAMVFLLDHAASIVQKPHVPTGVCVWVTVTNCSGGEEWWRIIADVLGRRFCHTVHSSRGCKTFTFYPTGEIVLLHCKSGGGCFPSHELTDIISNDKAKNLVVTYRGESKTVDFFGVFKRRVYDIRTSGEDAFDQLRLRRLDKSRSVMFGEPVLAAFKEPVLAAFMRHLLDRDISRFLLC